MLSKKAVAAELARRYVEFHSDKDWNTLKLWGLAHWSLISRHVKKGDLILLSKKQGRGPMWFYPSTDFYCDHVLPMIKSYLNDSREDKNLRWFEGDYI